MVIQTSRSHFLSRFTSFTLIFYFKQRILRSHKSTPEVAAFIQQFYLDILWSRQFFSPWLSRCKRQPVFILSGAQNRVHPNKVISEIGMLLRAFTGCWEKESTILKTLSLLIIAQWTIIKPASAIRTGELWHQRTSMMGWAYSIEDRRHLNSFRYLNKFRQRLPARTR